MKRAISAVLVVVLALIFCSPALAAKLGGRESAQALVEKGLAYIKANGKEKAFVEFSNPKGKFVKGDLYLFVIALNGVFLAHGADPSLVGSNQLQSKNEYVRTATIGLIETARKGGGWFSYKWPRPGTSTLQKKDSYVKMVDETAFIGCGVYE